MTSAIRVFHFSISIYANRIFTIVFHILDKILIIFVNVDMEDREIYTPKMLNIQPKCKQSERWLVVAYPDNKLSVHRLIKPDIQK